LTERPEHDVIIRLSGEVVKRKKKLSKKYYGTSHVLSMDEAKFIFERGCEQLILGSGQMGNVHLSPESSPFKSKSRLEAENAALRHQLFVLQRRVRGRVRLTNGDRLFLVQLYRWFPSVLNAITIIPTMRLPSRTGFSERTPIIVADVKRFSHQIKRTKFSAHTV
jgi:hypothetical protein